ncbi:glycosyltransferase [Brevibacillus fluminis]|uniref:glycosyltransferase n=1 Tax=Brevibacillus fluminis TaxID=511487 RepID=UPI003F8A4560
MSTNRPQFFKNLLKNYGRQSDVKKELIIILNNDRMNLRAYQRIASKYQHVSVYKLPQRYTLGSCLNFGITKAKYAFIAKFDDDDYYGPRYLQSSLRAFARTNAHVVGKRTYFLYLKKRKLLLIRFPFQENRFVRTIAGGTIMARRSVFTFIRFPRRSLGEDVGFYARCRAKGLRIFSTDRFNYVMVRRENKKSHTWQISDRKILSGVHQKVGYTKRYKAVARR